MTSYSPRDMRFVPLLRSSVVTGCAESSSFVLMFLGATGLTSVVAFGPAHHCLSSVVRDKTLHRKAAQGTKHEGHRGLEGRLIVRGERANRKAGVEKWWYFSVLT